MKYCPHCRKLLRPGTEGVEDTSPTHYSTTEAAIIAQKSVQTILNWCEAGRFPFFRVANGPRKVEKIPFLDYLASFGQDVSEARQLAELAIARHKVYIRAQQFRAENGMEPA